MTTPGSFVCCGVRIDGHGPESAVQALVASRYGVARGAHLCNSYTLSLAFRNPEYREVLNRGSLNFADGHYVAMIGRWRGQRGVNARVYGPDLMAATMDRGREAGLRHFLYGTTPRTIDRLQRIVAERYPGIQIVGAEAPPFRPLTAAEEDALIERVATARPDVFWVGVGTPRQDHFVGRFADRLGCTLVAVGAAFDFNSGAKKAAPRFVQRIGMEWFFRLIMEPRRLWRRYLIGIPIFISGVLADVFRRPTAPASPATSAPAATGVTIPAQHDPSAPLQRDPSAPLQRDPSSASANSEATSAVGGADESPIVPRQAAGHESPTPNGHATVQHARPAQPEPHR